MWLKRVYRFLISLFLALILLVLVAITIVHMYQDEIVALFVKQANQHINTPVKTAKVSVSLFARFPNVAVAFEDVWMKEGFAGSERPLAIASRVYCTFSIMDLIRKNYRIREIHIEDAEVFLRVRPSGEVNYQVMDGTATDDNAADGSMVFDLQKINLKNVLVEYDDRKHEQMHKVLAKNALARLRIEEPVYTIQLGGNLFTYEISPGKQKYFVQQHLELNTNFTFNTSEDQLRFQPSEVLLGGSGFLVQGDIGTAGDLPLNLIIEASQTDFQTIVAILPPEYTEQIRAYRSKGELKIQARVNGNAGGEHTPSIDAQFSAQQASFFHPEYNQSLEGINFSGRYTNGDAQSNRTSLVEVKDLKASLEGKPIAGSLVLRNFDDYHLTFNTNSVLDATSFLRFYPLKNVNSADGTLNVNLEFAGRLRDLENASSITKIKASGEVMVQNLNFKLSTTSYSVKKLNGSLIFNNNDLAISNLNGFAGKSSFVINGLFKNVFSYLLLDNQAVTIEADLQSAYLNLDELLADSQVEEPISNESDERYYSFDIRPNMDLYFNCKVDKLKFDRFHATDVSGELTVAGGVARVKNGSLKAAGGNMAIAGTVDARKTDQITVDVKAGFKNIYVDSVFWIFNNFSQNFLTDRHLKGRVTTDVVSHMQFDKKLRFNYDKLTVNANASIVDGQLKGFEPMQNLSSFVHEERLSNIKFSEITSSIQVRNQTIHLPETIIRSDISAVTIKGTHNFDQRIDYHIKVPVQTLITGKRKNVPVTAVKSENVSGTHLFLRIVGTTDDYKIFYDTEAVKEKIVKDIRKEKQELKEAIQKKSARTKEAVELDEEEYFDW